MARTWGEQQRYEAREKKRAKRDRKRAARKRAGKARSALRAIRDWA